MSGTVASGLTSWDGARSSSAGRTGFCCTTRPPATFLQNRLEQKRDGGPCLMM